MSSEHIQELEQNDDKLISEYEKLKKRIYKDTNREYQLYQKMVVLDKNGDTIGSCKVQESLDNVLMNNWNNNRTKRMMRTYIDCVV